MQLFMTTSFCKHVSVPGELGSDHSTTTVDKKSQNQPECWVHGMDNSDIFSFQKHRRWTSVARASPASAADFMSSTIIFKVLMSRWVAAWWQRVCGKGREEVGKGDDRCGGSTAGAVYTGRKIVISYYPPAPGAGLAIPTRERPHPSGRSWPLETYSSILFTVNWLFFQTHFS